MPTRYIVHGTDQAGRPVQKIFETDTAAQAEQTAGRLGIKVLGVEVDPSAPAAGPAPAPVIAGTQPVRQLGPETPLWKGTSSQWVNFWWFVACILVVPIPVAIWKYLVVRTTKFTLTSQRLRLERGVLSKVVDEVELYRVKDTQLIQSFLDRTIGMGTIEVLSSDDTNPVLHIPSIKNAREVREQLRQAVERLRLARGVREFDLAVESPGHM